MIKLSKRSRLAFWIGYGQYRTRLELQSLIHCIYIYFFSLYISIVRKYMRSLFRSMKYSTDYTSFIFSLPCGEVVIEG